MGIDEDLLYRLIGARVREKRALSMSQAELAKAINFKVRTSVTNIESGRQKPPLHLLYQICAVLDMDIKDLLPDLEEVREDGNVSMAGFIKSSSDLIEHPKAAQKFQELKGLVSYDIKKNRRARRSRG